MSVADESYRLGLTDLASLFQGAQSNSIPNGSQTVETFNPGSVGLPKAKAQQAQTLPKKESKRKESKDIWDDEETSIADVSDPRPEPDHDLKYRQKVSSEDIYLQMGGKTPSIACSDEFVITINLPNTIFKDIIVNCSQDSLDLRTPKLPVDDSSASAQWIQAEQKIIVTAPIKPLF
ncbi:Protein pih1d3 [Phlyctochytrium planicorne]|nr:Protein pih1d3 [Phlyctochytrium planicorne]